MRGCTRGSSATEWLGACGVLFLTAGVVTTALTGDTETAARNLFCGIPHVADRAAVCSSSQNAPNEPPLPSLDQTRAGLEADETADSETTPSRATLTAAAGMLAGAAAFAPNPTDPKPPTTKPAGGSGSGTGSRLGGFRPQLPKPGPGGWFRLSPLAVTLTAVNQYGLVGDITPLQPIETESGPVALAYNRPGFGGECLSIQGLKACRHAPLPFAEEDLEIRTPDGTLIGTREGDQLILKPEALTERARQAKRWSLESWLNWLRGVEDTTRPLELPNRVVFWSLSDDGVEVRITLREDGSLHQEVWHNGRAAPHLIRRVVWIPVNTCGDACKNAPIDERGRARLECDSDGKCTGPVCFAKGTPVLTPSGFRAIETIEVGEFVLARDSETGQTEARRVFQRFVTPDRALRELTLTSGGAESANESLKVTAEHPFFVPGHGWRRAEDLVVGDVVSALDGELEVASNVALDGRQTVYNLAVEEFHTYFVGETSAWVHNQYDVADGVTIVAWNPEPGEEIHRFSDIKWAPGTQQIALNQDGVNWAIELSREETWGLNKLHRRAGRSTRLRKTTAVTLATKLAKLTSIGGSESTMGIAETYGGFVLYQNSDHLRDLDVFYGPSDATLRGPTGVSHAGARMTERLKRSIQNLGTETLLEDGGSLQAVVDFMNDKLAQVGHPRAVAIGSQPNSIRFNGHRLDSAEQRLMFRPSIDSTTTRTDSQVDPENPSADSTNGHEQDVDPNPPQELAPPEDRPQNSDADVTTANPSNWLPRLLPGGMVRAEASGETQYYRDGRDIPSKSHPITVIERANGSDETESTLLYYRWDYARDRRWDLEATIVRRDNDSRFGKASVEIRVDGKGPSKAVRQLVIAALHEASPIADEIIVVRGESDRASLTIQTSSDVSAPPILDVFESALKELDFQVDSWDVAPSGTVGYPLHDLILDVSSDPSAGSVEEPHTDGSQSAPSQARHSDSADDPVCFAAGTPVLTPSGLRAIETIAVGDLVLSRDAETGRTEARPVFQRFVTPNRPLRKLTLTSGGPESTSESLKVTAEHPFFVPERGWRRAEDLMVGDVVSALDGELVVTSNVSLDGRQTVYNLAVEEFHTYFVGEASAWVHNQYDITDGVEGVPIVPWNPEQGEEIVYFGDIMWAPRTRQLTLNREDIDWAAQLEPSELEELTRFYNLAGQAESTGDRLGSRLEGIFEALASSRVTEVPSVAGFAWISPGVYVLYDAHDHRPDGLDIYYGRYGGTIRGPDGSVQVTPDIAGWLRTLIQNPNEDITVDSGSAATIADTIRDRLASTGYRLDVSSNPETNTVRLEAPTEWSQTDVETEPTHESEPEHDEVTPPDTRSPLEQETPSEVAENVPRVFERPPPSPSDPLEQILEWIGETVAHFWDPAHDNATHERAIYRENPLALEILLRQAAVPESSRLAISSWVDAGDPSTPFRLWPTGDGGLILADDHGGIAIGSRSVRKFGSRVGNLLRDAFGSEGATFRITDPPDAVRQRVTIAKANDILRESGSSRVVRRVRGKPVGFLEAPEDPAARSEIPGWKRIGRATHRLEMNDREIFYRNTRIRASPGAVRLANRIEESPDRRVERSSRDDPTLYQHWVELERAFREAGEESPFHMVRSPSNGDTKEWVLDLPGASRRSR